VKPPLHPLWVLLIAALLPGVGQVINNAPKRGVMFLFFMMSLRWVTLHLAPPEASFVGRYAGGFFIHASRSWTPTAGPATGGRSFVKTPGVPTAPLARRRESSDRA
jgi:hypothetical protein